LITRNHTYQVAFTNEVKSPSREKKNKKTTAIVKHAR
jgi:hypothetical protein